jgi:YesN/AraC family two-component response regulator
LKAMSGNVSASSAMGQGSVFSITLPLKKSAMAAEAAAAPLESQGKAALPKGHHLTRVLLAEDNADLRDFIRLVLPAEVYELQLAENGRATLALLEAAQQQSQLPDLIITDLMMPEMDGLELIHFLKTNEVYQSIPIIVLTARANAHAEFQALRIGVDDYLIKPFGVDELLTRMDHLLYSYRQRQASQEGMVYVENAWLALLEQTAVAQIGEPNFSLETLSESLNLSVRQLQRRLKAATGLTATQYLQELRLQQARRLIESGQTSSVKALCEALGLRDTKYFSRAFKKRFGRLPSAHMS